MVGFVNSTSPSPDFSGVQQPGQDIQAKFGDYKVAVARNGQLPSNNLGTTAKNTNETAEVVLHQSTVNSPGGSRTADVTVTTTTTNPETANTSGRLASFTSQTIFPDNTNTSGATGHQDGVNNNPRGYDPKNVESMKAFLQRGDVQMKMLQKGGHIVVIDPENSSFIFCRNGDLNNPESIKVVNGRTKEPLDSKDLTTACASYCLAYNDLEGDWIGRLEAKVAGKAGLDPGTPFSPRNLLISYKFKMAGVYGDYEGKEAQGGNNGTPSIWRRGHQPRLTSPNVYEPGGFDPVSLPNKGNAGAAAANNTQQPPWPPFQMPAINVNVNVGDVNVTTNNNTGSGTGSTETKASEETENASKTDLNDAVDNKSDIDTGKEENEGIWGEDNLGLSDLFKEPENTNNTNTDNKNAGGLNNEDGGLEGLLAAVRKHLDVVYPGDHNPDNGALPANQQLGDVISDYESGGADNVKPTVVTGANNTNGTESTTSSQETANAADTSGVTGNTATPQSTTFGPGILTGAKNLGTRLPPPKNENDLGILQAVRQHLDVVFPEGGNGQAQPVNQNLGDVISDYETGGADNVKPTVVTGANNTNGTESTGNTTGTENATGTAGTENTTTPSPISATIVTTPAPKPEPGPKVNPLPVAASIMVTKGPQLTGSGGLAALLERTRGHLDKAFDPEGNLKPGMNGPNLGSIITDFRNETGSGGLFGPINASPVTTSVPQMAFVEGGDNNKGELLSAVKDVAKALSDLIDTTSGAVGQNNKIPPLNLSDEGLAGPDNPIYTAAGAVTASLGNMAGIVENSANPPQKVGSVVPQFTASSAEVPGTRQEAPSPLKSSNGPALQEAARDVTEALGNVADSVINAKDEDATSSASETDSAYESSDEID